MAYKRVKPLKRPVQKRSQQTVAAMLQAGVHILNKHGWDAFTTRNVADKAGVSYGSLYQYFPNRESLLRVIILDRLERDVSELQKIMQSQTANQQEKEILSRLVAKLIAWHQDDVGMRMVVYQKVNEVNLGQEVKKAQSELMELFGRMIMQIKGDRHLDSARIEILFYAVLGVCHAMGPLRDVLSFKEIERSLLHLISSYLSD